MPSDKAKNIILNYEGVLDFETIGVLIGKLQSIVKRLNTKIYIYKKVLSVMIESLENIYKYYSDKDFNSLPEGHIPNFQIISEGNSFIIHVSNPVRVSDIPKVKNKLESINKLDHHGLKELYKNTITNGQFSDKGGAGLGFIEMAKISGRKLEFSFNEIDTNFAIFNLSIII